MRGLLILIALGAFGWSGWWWVGSTAKEAAINGWLEERRAAGWVAEHQGLGVTGYPSRFDTIITGLQLADPASGWAWDAPEFQVLGLSYKPNHVIAVWPGTQTIAAPDQRVEVNSEMLRGSVVFEPNTRLALDRTSIEIADLSLVSDAGWTAALAKGQFSTRQSPDGAAPDFAHDIAFSATDLRLPEPLKDALDPAGVLPALFSTAEMDLTAAFSAPWDRIAVEGEKPDITALNLRDLTLRWGKLDLRAKGSVIADATGRADGRIDLVAKNWREMLHLAVQSGYLSAEMAQTMTSGMELLALLGGDPDTLKAPLIFSGGLMRLGPIPIGEAPLLN